MRPLVVAGAAVSLGVAYYLWRRRKASTQTLSCCPPGSAPPLAALSAADAPALGTECEMAGLTTYVTGAPNAQRCVIVIHDIWGMRAGRHRQVCDVLAKSLCCSVLLPDLFHGDVCTKERGPGTPGFGPWAKQWTPSSVSADLDRLMATLPPTCKVGVVGFCWGSFAALLAASAAGEANAVRAACFAHPSHRKIMEVVHKMAPEDVGEYYLGVVRAPTLCLTAGNDDPRCKPGGADENLIKMSETPTSFAEFEKMPHGWVIKGDIDEPVVALEVQRAVGMISGWLDEHL